MKIVIIGSVAGGAFAAARARRIDKTAEIVILRSEPGISSVFGGTPCYIGGEIKHHATMVLQPPASLDETLNINVRVNTRVNEINTEKKNVTAQNQCTGELVTIDYDHLILAIGASAVKPPIPGIDGPGVCTLRNLDDMDAILAWTSTTLTEYSESHCVVAGAGFIGLEMVEQLVRRKMRVTIVEMMPQVLGPLDVEMASTIQNDLTDRGVTVITGDGISELRPAEAAPNSSIVVLRSGRILPPAQMTILGLGARASTEIAEKAGIEVTPRGHVVVDDQLRTSVPNVWAVGDAFEFRNPILGGGEMWAVPLAGPANRQGRMVADNIYGKGKIIRKCLMRKRMIQTSLCVIWGR